VTDGAFTADIEEEVLTSDHTREIEEGAAL
jgi:hypothetical protein